MRVYQRLPTALLRELIVELDSRTNLTSYHHPNQTRPLPSCLVTFIPIIFSGKQTGFMRPCISRPTHSLAAFSLNTTGASKAPHTRLPLPACISHASTRSRGYASVGSPSRVAPLGAPPGFVGATTTNSRLTSAPTLTAIHNVRELLPRILAPDSPDRVFWDRVLHDVYEDTSGTLASSGRKLGVVGM